ncbi:DUF2487 family protein [Paenibacillus sp. R14(2021)]|uniref:DUF2487 family protein n=1 Tax=Paenibacillus sp. R14(2021) TaxID=2859228 RepID=UPI001C615986|nr:DUF2487 family protein [Paenibacillus sp. R14(2021)]
MKFSELSAQQWAELQPYLDTAVLPVTGLTGMEMPYEVTEQLERLRDVLDMIEQPFKGRIVTYPAVQYGPWTYEIAAHVSQVCNNLRTIGFKYVILAAAVPVLSEAKPNADLMIGPADDGSLPEAAAVSESVRKLWLGRP